MILKRVNAILKTDIGLTEDDDKFMEKIHDFLDNELPIYLKYDEVIFKIYMQIYEKIVSIKFLVDPNVVRLRFRSLCISF